MAQTTKENYQPFQGHMSQSMNSNEDRLSQCDLQILQLQRQIEELRKDQKDLD